MFLKPTQIKNLRIINFNANGIKRQIYELQYLLLEHSIDIALITETHLEPTDRFTLRNYDIIRSDRPYRRGGGTAIIIKRNISYAPVQIIGLTCAEITAITLLLDKKRSNDCIPIYSS